MNLDCKWVEGILSVLILVSVIWPTLIFSANVSWWIIVISAILLLIHSFHCNKCSGGKPVRRSRARKTKAKKRKRR